jgi:preprotein translocase subunit YajC
MHRRKMSLAFPSLFGLVFYFMIERDKEKREIKLRELIRFGALLLL